MMPTAKIKLVTKGSTPATTLGTVWSLCACSHTDYRSDRNNSKAGVPVCMLTALAPQSKSENS